jgi:hypothetical protein
LVGHAKADATLAEYRLTGFCLRLGVRAKPLALPRRRSVRRALARAAETDPRIAAALDHAEQVRRRNRVRDEAAIY